MSLRATCLRSLREPRTGAMNDAILREIADFCRRTGVAESTFGRRAVNDGKLASRLRNGGRITTDTLDRIRAFMTENVSGEAARPVPPYVPPPPVVPMLSKPLPGRTDPARNFRFFDN